MKPQTEEWVLKAEGDFESLCALMELHIIGDLKCDTICFLSQQCVEKYMKARLVEADIEFEKTHDLYRLLEYVYKIEPEWMNHKQDLMYLSSFAIAYRYPGDTATDEDAQMTFDIATSFRQIVRHSLGLPIEE